MFRYARIWIPFLLAAQMIAAGGGVIRAADEQWEKLPNGVLGQVAGFEGVGGVRIAGYMRKPAGPGPFSIVIVLHGGRSTARPVRADSEEARARLMADVL